MFKVSISDGYVEWEFPLIFNEHGKFSIAKVHEALCLAIGAEVQYGKIRKTLPWEAVGQEEPLALISMKEYKRLAQRDSELSQLEHCGVDNWSGYGQYNEISGGDGCQETEDAVVACDNYIYEINDEDIGK